MDNQSPAAADAALAEMTKAAAESGASSWSLLLQPATLFAVAIGLVVAMLQVDI